MKILKQKQVLAVACHEIKGQLSSFTYWTIILWPLLIAAIFERSGNIHLDLSTSNYLNLDLFWGNFLPIFIFMVSLSYVSIMANSVAADKTSKISEMLLAMVDAKEQLIGKISATYCLMLLHMTIYTGLIYIYERVTHGFIVQTIIKNTSPVFFVYIVLDAAVALFMALVWVTEIASYVTDESQVAVAVIPVMLLIGTGTMVAFLFNAPHYFDAGISVMRVYANVVLAFPPIGSLLMPTLLANQNVSYVEAYLNIVIQLVIIAWLLKQSIRQYRFGLLSSKKANPFLSVLVHENTGNLKENKR